MGRTILDGGDPVWDRAGARGNWWGAPGGPTADINWVELALAFSNQREQSRRLADDLPLESAGPVHQAIDDLAAQWGTRFRTPT